MNRTAYAVVHTSALAVWERPEAVLGVNTQRPHVVVIQSTCRRVKKERIKVDDLQPVKDIKGGGGITGESKRITGRIATTGIHLIQKGHYRFRNTSKWNLVIGRLSAMFRRCPTSSSAGS